MTIADQLAQLEQAMRNSTDHSVTYSRVLSYMLSAWADTLRSIQQQMQAETSGSDTGTRERLGRMEAPASTSGPQTAAAVHHVASGDRSRDGRP